MVTNISFAKNFKELLDSKQISLRKLETELNINHTTLSRWLNGKTMPNADYLCIIADYFNCSIDFLLGRIDY
jgi:transcriptional regulator with XRE-family HTH domain